MNNTNKRNKTKYTKTILSFPELGALGSGSPRQSRTGLGSRQELDSGTHGSESGSGSRAGQQAGSSSEAGYGRREREPRDPPALTWVRRAWRGIPCWSLLGHLSVRPSLHVWPFTTPHLSDLRGLSATLAASVIIISKGIFLHSFLTVSSVQL